VTEPYYEDGPVVIYAGDCLDVLPTLPDASADAVVTDPPYLLGFMGREWDTRAAHEHLDWHRAWADEAYRVMKPGAHLLAFGGTRTSHRLACAIEDAGFEIRDSIAWLYGSGFPKSLDVSKAIDKRPGVTRHKDFAQHLAAAREAAGLSRADVSEKVVGTRSGACWNWEHHQFPEAKWWPALRDLLNMDDATWGPVIAEAERQKIGERTTGIGTGNGTVRIMGDGNRDVTTNATDDARTWQGWGTALKPAHEPIVVARKPLTGSVASNVLRHGTGALNVDGCRVGTDSTVRTSNAGTNGDGWRFGKVDHVNGSTAGRWPANVVLDEDQAAALDLMSGDVRASGHVNQSVGATGTATIGPVGLAHGRAIPGVNTYNDFGGASRFFYVAKADSAERPFYYRRSCECEDSWPTTSHARAITAATALAASSTSKSGSVTTASESPTATRSTTSTATNSTTTPTTSSPSPLPTTSASTPAASSATANGGSPALSATSSSPSPRPTGTSASKAGRSTAAAVLATSPAWSATSVCGACGAKARREAHATVKPLSLMRWLVRLVTPPGGTVLEPFAGSGTTVEACVLEGFRCIAIEREADYLPLITSRLRQGAFDFDLPAPRPAPQPDDTRRGEASAERRYTDRGGSNFAMKPGRRYRDAPPAESADDAFDFGEGA
jgi:DNA modification methylase